MGKSYNEKHTYYAKYGNDEKYNQPKPSELVKIKNDSIIDDFAYLYIEKEYFSGRFGYYRTYTKEADGTYIPYMGATSDEYDRMFNGPGGFSRILKVRGDYIK